MDSFGLKKRTSENKKQRLWTALFSGGLLSYVFLFFVITAAYFLFKPLWEYSGIARATCSSLAVCGVLVIAFCLFWLHQGGRLTHRHLLLALIATSARDTAISFAAVPVTLLTGTAAPLICTVTSSVLLKPR